MTLPVDGPNTDATIVRAADVPTLLVGSTTARLVAVGGQTEGRYGLFRWNMTARSGPATPHYHRTFSEAFYVLDGQIHLYNGLEWRDAGPGDFLSVPPGGVHGFRNLSKAPVSMLILFAPAPPREEYFRALADRVANGVTETEDERRAFLARHDQYEV